MVASWLDVSALRCFWPSQLTLNLKGAIQANMSKRKKKGKTQIKIVDNTGSPETPANESSKLPSPKQDVEDSLDELAHEDWALPDETKEARTSLPDHEGACRETSN
jgi:hypothetical protein